MPRAPPPDPGAAPRQPRPVLAGRPDAGVPLGSPASRRGGARPAQGRARGRIQIHLLPLDGPGEARRLTDLPRGVAGLRVVARRHADSSVVDASLGATVDEDARRRRGTSVRPGPGEPPRLRLPVHRPARATCSTAPASPYDRVAHLWLVDAATGAATRLTDGPGRTTGARLVAGRHAHRVRRRTAGAIRTSPSARPSTSSTSRRATSPRSPAARDPSSGSRRGCPTGRPIAALGHRLEAGGGSATTSGCSPPTGPTPAPDGGAEPVRPARPDARLGDGQRRDAAARRPGSWPSPDGRSITFTAPIDGSYELWRIAVDRRRTSTRLTDGRHYICALGRRARTARPAADRRICARAPTEPPDLWLQGRGRRSHAG